MWRISTRIVVFPTHFKECFDCLQSFENNKSPGNDGLTAEFYETFWNSIGNLVVDSLNYSYECGELSNTQKTSNNYIN